MNKILIPFLLTVLIFSATTDAEIRVYAAIAEDEDIYPGEPFQYQIIIDGHDKPGAADVTPMAPFSPRDAGGRFRGRRRAVGSEGDRRVRSRRLHVAARR